MKWVCWGASKQPSGFPFSALGPRSTQSVHLVRLGVHSFFKQGPPVSWHDWTGTPEGWMEVGAQMEDCGEGELLGLGNSQRLPPSRSRCRLLHPQPSPASLFSTLHSECSQLLPHREMGARCLGALTSVPWVGRSVASLGRRKLTSFPPTPRHTLSWWDWAPVLRGSEVPAPPRGVGGVRPCLPIGLTRGSILCSLTRNKGALWGDICFAPCLVSRWKSGSVDWASTQERPALLPSPPPTTPLLAFNAESLGAQRTSPLGPEHHEPERPGGPTLGWGLFLLIQEVDCSESRTEGRLQRLGWMGLGETEL